MDATLIDPRRQPSPVRPSPPQTREPAAAVSDWGEMVGASTVGASLESPAERGELTSATLPAIELDEDLVFPPSSSSPSPFEPELSQGLPPALRSEDPTDSGLTPPRAGPRPPPEAHDPTVASDLLESAGPPEPGSVAYRSDETEAFSVIPSSGELVASVSDLDLGLAENFDPSAGLLEPQPVALHDPGPPDGASERTIAAPGELAGLAAGARSTEASFPALEQPEWSFSAEPAASSPSPSGRADELGSAVHAMHASSFDLEPPDWGEPQPMAPQLGADSTDAALDALMDSRPVSMPGEVVPSGPAEDGWIHAAHEGQETHALPAVEGPPDGLRLTVASLPRRLGALVFDALLAGAAMWWASAGALLAAVPPGREPEAWMLELGNPSFLARVLGTAVILTLVFGLLEGLIQRTPGKLLFGLRTRRAGGGPLGVKRALLRAGVGLLGLAACGIGYAWILVDRRCRGLHGVFTGTVVIQGPIEGA